MKPAKWILIIIFALWPAVAGAVERTDYWNYMNEVLGGQDQEQSYLGGTYGEYDSHSIANEIGSYGSIVGVYSINNNVGRFGSDTSSYSARNPFTSIPPILYYQANDGLFYPDIYVTKNQYIAGDYLDPDKLVTYIREHYYDPYNTPTPTPLPTATPTPSPTPTPTPTPTPSPTPVARDASVFSASSTNHHAEVWMRNTGTESWTGTAGFSLAVIDDPAHLCAATRYGLGNLTISPDEAFQFEVPLTMPPHSGHYTARFRMVKEFVEFFGETAMVQVANNNSAKVWELYE